ncbi:nose resistant to fluoxetine protein 6-like [Drosophila ficusphila]|uniref:nose resistant to fluoxetine protein 6-like n=1 Tax=Drosophila ficusphila TaxID=30025 RepID=UPI0007E746A8|nr:nose resistant to fluoxetine protein 6-like [Drosophila ficusphila]
MINVISVLLVFGLVSTSASETADPDVQNNKLSKQLPLDFSELFRNVTLESFGLSANQKDFECKQDLAALLRGLSSSQMWAQKMVDSWGSIPSGLLTGNTFDLGNFDECLSVNQVISSSQKISGKYCFLIANKLKIATCFPSSCTATQMDPIVQQLIQKLFNADNSSISLKISEESCQTSESPPWDALTIVTIVILSVMGVLVTLFTFYDYFLCRDQNRMPALVKAFSARANSRSLFRIVPNKSNPNVIDCLHGIRCMSLFWVIYSHEFIFFVKSPNLNTAEIFSWAITPFASFVLHGYFSVDSFFVLGGMLVCMVALRSMEKSGGKLNPLVMYLHRIIRILPVVAIAILVYMTMMTVISSGPMLKSGYHGKEYCQKGWFWTLLFVQNYAVLNICLDHTWYLAVDMQLYILSPILLLALYKWGKKAASGIAVLVVLLSGCLFATQMVNHYSLLIKNSAEDDGVPSKKLYLATHTHAAPWLIGFLFGYFLHLNRGKRFQLSLLVVWTGWILSLAMLFTSIFALYPAGKWTAPPLSTLDESLYYTLTRIGWPLAICWVIFACMQGYGSLANSFLSTPLWQPLSRLSYSVYIWHMFVQEINMRSGRTNTYFSNYSAMERFWYDFGFTVLMSYLLYLIIEAPLCGFDSLLRPRPNPSADDQPKLIQEQKDVANSSVTDCTETETKPLSVSDAPK